MRRFLPILIWILYTLVVGWIGFRTSIIWWSLGMMVSILIFFLDRILYVWWLKPYEQLSIQVQYWWQRRDWLAALRLLLERSHEQTKLIVRSLVFLLLWPFLAVYVYTSTGSVTAVGLIMGLGLGLAMDIVTDWREYRRLHQWLCWQIKRDIKEYEVRLAAGAFIALFIIFTLILLMRG